jgi:hypothetical protein
MFVFAHAATYPPGGDISSRDLVYLREHGYLVAYDATCRKWIAPPLRLPAGSRNVLIYSLSGSGTHAPRLHMLNSAVTVPAHVHDHGGHSHDKLNLEQVDSQAGDNHHADHSHEKAGLVGAIRLASRMPVSISYRFSIDHLASGRQFGIDWPPRSMT